MKKIFLIMTMMMLVILGYGQTKDPQNIKVVASAEPSYPKGDNELYAYVMHNLKYPEETIRKYVEGEVSLSFDVKSDSTVSNVVLISGVGYGIDEELQKLIKTLKFNPGVQNGVPVRMSTMYSFPVKAH
jgi:periplasmic protein TonB